MDPVALAQWHTVLSVARQPAGGAQPRVLEGAFLPQRSVVQPRLHGRGKSPARFWVSHREQVTEGNVDDRMRVVGASFKNQNFVSWVCREAIAEQAACRSRTDHDVVILLIGRACQAREGPATASLWERRSLSQAVPGGSTEVCSDYTSLYG